MKRLFLIVVTMTVFVTAGAQIQRAEDERAAKLAELDAICEAARQKALVAERAKHVEECVETKMLEDRETCERFYADWGESAANQAPLFYDLPECEAAHDFRNSHRSSDR